MLPINIANILNTIKGILLGYYTSASPKVINILNDYAKDSEKTFTDIATGALSKELTYAFVISAIKTQETILKDQLLSVGEVVASEVEQIVNTAMKVFEDALKMLIPIKPTP